MKQYLRKDILIPLFTVTCVLAVCLMAGLYVYQKHRWVQAQLTDFIEPRYARLAGVRESVDALAVANARAREMESLYIYPSEQDASQTGNDAQQRIRTLLAAAGMGIASSQVLTSKDDSGIEHIPISVRAEGDIAALHGALVGIAEQRPAILIDTINIQAQGAPDRGVQRLSVQFGFTVLRRGQP